MRKSSGAKRSGKVSESKKPDFKKNESGKSFSSENKPAPKFSRTDKPKQQVVKIKSDKDEIERAINDLVDYKNPSMNQKCARIREAFRNYLDEDTAKFYFVSGYNGGPKKIKLPRHLMTMHFK